jgi:hypothetical protein
MEQPNGSQLLQKNDGFAHYRRLILPGPIFHSSLLVYHY